MKVLSKVDTSNWSYIHTCAMCESELEVEKSDIKYYYDEGYNQRESGYETWTANCAVCNTSFNIPLSELPRALQIEIKMRAKSTIGILDR